MVFMEKLINTYEEVLQGILDIALTHSDRERIKKGLSGHEDCVENGNIDVAIYGGHENVENVTIECSCCGMVFSESKVIMPACKEQCRV
jgi:hypothetical protein